MGTHFVCVHFMNNKLKTTMNVAAISMHYWYNVSINKNEMKLNGFIEYKICKELLRIYLLFIWCLSNKRCTHDYGCVHLHVNPAWPIPLRFLFALIMFTCLPVKAHHLAFPCISVTKHPVMNKHLFCKQSLLTLASRWNVCVFIMHWWNVQGLFSWSCFKKAQN